MNVGAVAVGGTTTLPFTIRSVGSDNLQVSSVRLVYSAASPVEQTEGPAFACQAPDGSACQGYGWGTLAPGAPSLPLNIVFKRYQDNAERVAILQVVTNDASSPLEVVFSTSAGTPKLSTRDTVDFGFVDIEETRIEDVPLFNVGNDVLRITAIESLFDKADRFTMVLDGTEYAAGPTLELDPPLEIAPNKAVDFQLIYTAPDQAPQTGGIALRTNDFSNNDDAAGRKLIPVSVNSTGPCLKLVPGTVVFPATPVGEVGARTLQLESCGDAPVSITSIDFDDAGPGDFSIDWASIADLGGNPPSVEAPLVIGVNESRGLLLNYTPSQTSEIKDGQPVPDTAVVVVERDGGKQAWDANLEGVSSNGGCPTAIITVQEGDTVVPQTLLNLDGSQSFAAAGAISGYVWEVEQPVGSVGLLQPNNKSPQVQFQPNVAGEYTFRLTVFDEGGTPSCFPAERKVTVIPDQAIHVELLWNTPGDIDQSDEGPAAGSDMDLHFAHPFASGLDFDNDGKADPWFDAKYDAFWFNKSPEWGSYDPNIDDNPSLDRDDTDGAGPENLNLTLPEDGRTYAVGVHYFEDHGKGGSTAEVRIYIYGNLAFQVTSEQMLKGDLWYVADVEWPSGDVSAKKDLAGTAPFFNTPNYPAPAL